MFSLSERFSGATYYPNDKSLPISLVCIREWKMLTNTSGAPVKESNIIVLY